MFCKKCGLRVSDGSSFCSSCGEIVDVQHDKFMAALFYIGIFCLIPMFEAKGSKYIQHHASQGLTLHLFCLAYTITAAIADSILFIILPWTMFGIYLIASILWVLGYIPFIVFAVMGIVNAVQGQMKKLPVIGRIDILGKLKE